MFQPLDASSLDALREVSTVGAGHAATALAQMTGATVQLSVPAVRSLPLSEVSSALGGDEAPVAALHMRVYGDMRANALLSFPDELMEQLLTPLTGAAPSGGDSDGSSASCRSPTAAGSSKSSGRCRTWFGS